MRSGHFGNGASSSIEETVSPSLCLNNGVGSWQKGLQNGLRGKMLLLQNIQNFPMQRDNFTIVTKFGRRSDLYSLGITRLEDDMPCPEPM